MNKYGCKKEINDRRDYKVKVVSSIEYPKEYSLEMPKVKNQGDVSSCVAHSFSTFLENYFNDKFSVGFIYGYRPDGYSKDEGMYPREALKTLQKIGDVRNEVFNYNKEVPDIINLVNKDIDKLTQLARPYRILSYARLYTEKEIKKCLFSGTPVPASIPVYNDLKTDKNGIISKKGECEGYHMIIICGWNEQGFIFQNSWGEHWGKNGKGIIPYGYEINSAWAISMEQNNISTYQTWYQKLYKFILKIIKLFKKGE